MKIVIVGAGVFGITAALELRARQHDVLVIDPGPIPHPLASSTDHSKAVRLDYGSDEGWTSMAEAALPLWMEWNERFGETLFHQDGFLFLTAEPMQEGGFEHDSFHMLTDRGFELDPVDRDTLRERFPAFDAERYAGGYFNPHDGWAESGRVVEVLSQAARADGVELRAGQRFEALIESGGRIAGVRTDDGPEHEADIVLVTAGAWTPAVLPWLEGHLRAIGQAVCFLRVTDPDAWRPPKFVTWASDIATTGWYGFPALPDGTVKVANHGPGREVAPGQPLNVTDQEEARCQTFAASALPELATAPIAGRRLCLYCDTKDGAFWIDHDPERPGLVVAAGGSGHAFKFAPLLGGIIADVVERRRNPWADRFRWRESVVTGVESARKADQ